MMVMNNEWSTQRAAYRAATRATATAAGKAVALVIDRRQASAGSDDDSPCGSLAVKRNERYGGGANACVDSGDESTRIDIPDRVIVSVTGSPEHALLQARWVAERLSDWFAGCDHYYMVEGDDDAER